MSGRLDFILALAALLALSRSPSHVNAQSDNPPFPAFNSPYATEQPLASLLVFTSQPRPNVPDGQIHWTDSEVPGIDVRGPDGVLRNMCPEDGLAWTTGLDIVGGGGLFVAVECQGKAQGWQMLAFHLCEVSIRTSISASQRQYTQVAPGAVLAAECPHTHLSLGYWAGPENKIDLPCPQWHVQGRWWVNAACMAQSQRLPTVIPGFLARTDDWELQLLQPDVLGPLRQASLPIVTLALGLYLVWAMVQAPPDQPAEARPRRAGPGTEALVKTGVWLGFIVLIILFSAGPIWPVGNRGHSAYTTADQPYQTMAQSVGYGDWRLLKAFYAAAVPRDEAGRPVNSNEAGRVFPPEAAAAIPFGETNAEDWGVLVDPTQAGVHGQLKAWEAVAERWPPSLYERVVLGLTVSRTAQNQRAGLEAITNNSAVQALARRLGKPITAQTIYGSSAGAIGRTQILPGHFAPGGVCAEAASADVWNDPYAIAECTTRYLTVSGCWGSWWANGDVWSALCGYNPGAWNVAEHQWYWTVLQDRMTRLASASEQFALAAPVETVMTSTVTAPLPPAENYVPTPMLGLMITETLLQNGQGASALPGPLPEIARALEPHLRLPERREAVRTAYRLFRAWMLIYYSPQELLELGVQF